MEHSPPKPVLAAHLRSTTTPVADPANVLHGRHWRISVLDAGLVRLQWSPSGRFAEPGPDPASQAVLHRDFPPVTFSTRGEPSDEQSDEPSVLEVITDRLHLTYDKQAFSAHGLSVQARGAISNYHSTWRFGSQGEGNLGGTARTLDLVDGRVDLEDGIASRHGVACYDDSHTVLLDDDGWFTAREPGSLDLYVFAFGRDYRAALSVFYRLTGAPPLVPRWALGNWWSRYHAYTAEEYLALFNRFTDEGLPFSVAVLDMDWHVTDVDPAIGSGWTGYTWNRNLIPDPPALLADLHEGGLKVALNVHPADGIRAHEEAYPAVAAAMGLDPASRLPVAFDPTDPRFLATYLADVHHRLEADGVDLWWLDWQQGRSSRVAGLDPLWLLNHLHFLDAGRPGGPLGARPLTFSRYAGVGSHRYPIGFSGDTVVSWASLAFQPEFTARASNVGYGWWSHDIGGHMFGVKDDELATRWVQLGAFSPILRLHSTFDEFNSKEPWRFGPVAREVMRYYLRLRHRLLPYLATMARRAHVDGLPLVQPMYYEHPWQEGAYEVDNQFYFGSELVIAPVVTPLERATGLARVDVWLPPGEWVDLMTAIVYTGGRTIPMHRPLATLPVLARPGMIAPVVAESAVSSSTRPSRALEVIVVAGADGEFELVEDNDDDAWATTRLSYRHAAGEIIIGAVDGSVDTVGPQRDWTLCLIGFGDVDEVRVAGRSVPLETGQCPKGTIAHLGLFATDQAVTVTVHGELRLVGTDVERAVYELLDAAQIAFAAKKRVWELVTSLPPGAAALALHSLDLAPEVVTAVSELLLARAEAPQGG